MATTQIKATVIRWHKATRTYTVSNCEKIVRDIQTMSQAKAVKIDLKYGWEPCFGQVTERRCAA
jgi:hypothetical protein